MVNRSKDYYEILGVERNASLEEIKNRYKFLVYVFHPDRLQDSILKSNAENELKKINEAYAILSNQNRRKEYDNNLVQEEELKGEREGEKENTKRKKTEKANAILSYVSQIVRYWTDRWHQIPYDEELEKMRASISLHTNKIIFGTKSLWSPEAREQQEVVEKALMYTIVACLSLGIEKREKGLTTLFSEDEILTSIALIFTETLTPIAVLNVNRSFLEESEAMYHLDQVFKLILNVCLLSFYLLSGKVKILDNSQKQTKPPLWTKEGVQKRPNVQTNPRNVEKGGGSGCGIGIILILFTIIMALIFSGYRDEKSIYPTSTPQKLVVNYPTSTPKRSTVTPYPTRTRPNPTPTYSCNKWDRVTINDQGKTLCVYGEVRKTYFAENDFHIIFGSNDSDFRFIVTNGYYYEGLIGNCVMGEGVVKVYNSLPYIIVVDDLYKCP